MADFSTYQTDDYMIVTIGYLKELGCSGIPSSLSNTYCPKYSEITGGSVVSEVGVKGTYASNQLVIHRDLVFDTCNCADMDICQEYGFYTRTDSVEALATSHPIAASFSSAATLTPSVVSGNFITSFTTSSMGSNHVQYVANLIPNTSTSPKTAVIKYASDKGCTFTQTLIQEGAVQTDGDCNLYNFEVGETSVDYYEDTYEIASSDLALTPTVTRGGDFLTVTRSNSNNSYSYSGEFAENTAYSARTATVVYTSQDGNCVFSQYIIQQAAPEPTSNYDVLISTISTSCVTSFKATGGSVTVYIGFELDGESKICTFVLNEGENWNSKGKIKLPNDFSSYSLELMYVSTNTNNGDLEAVGGTYPSTAGVYLPTLSSSQWSDSSSTSGIKYDGSTMPQFCSSGDPNESVLHFWIEDVNHNSKTIRLEFDFLYQ